MLKKIILFFFVILLSFSISVSAQAQNTAENSINESGNATESLNNIEKLPTAEDISAIASTIKKAIETYQSLKIRVISLYNYFQMAYQSIKEAAEKIENGGRKTKEYIEYKLNRISKKHEINLRLI